MKRFICLVFIALFLVGTACADGITPRADEVFSSASASLATNKSVYFTMTVKQPKESIKIVDCWLLTKRDDGKWVTVVTLPKPATVAKDTCFYDASMDYADKIGTGTFRVGFTVNADGYTITRFSNERTYK